MYIGYRCWLPTVDDNNVRILASLVSTYQWDSPVAVSGKPAPKKEVASYGVDINPSLGIYSNSEYEHFIKEIKNEDCAGVVMGIIGNFGTVRIHERGYRSEKSQILALCNYIECDYKYCTHATQKIGEMKQKDVPSFAYCEEHYKKSIEHNFINFDREWYDVDVVLNDYANRYQCDIVSLDDFINFKENYNGHW